MAAPTIRILDAASDFSKVQTSELLSTQDLANRVQLGVFDGCTIVRLPSEFTIVLSVGRPEGGSIQAVPGLSQGNLQGPVFWLELTTLHQSHQGTAGLPGQNQPLQLAPATLNAGQNAGQPLPSRQKNGPARTPNSVDEMTENQRRYLFRLLAERNLPLDQAKTYLLEYFHVASIRDISKQGASDLIDKFVNGGDRS